MWDALSQARCTFYCSPLLSFTYMFTGLGLYDTNKCEQHHVVCPSSNLQAVGPGLDSWTGLPTHLFFHSICNSPTEATSICDLSLTFTKAQRPCYTHKHLTGQLFPLAVCNCMITYLNNSWFDSFEMGRRDGSREEVHWGMLRIESLECIHVVGVSVDCSQRLSPTLYGLHPRPLKTGQHFAILPVLTL